MDYVLVPYEQLSRFYNFEVILAKYALQCSFDIQMLEQLSIPDHSLLMWEVSLKTVIQKTTNEEFNDTRQTHVI